MFVSSRFPRVPETGDAGTYRYFLVDALPPLLERVAAAAPPAALVDLGAGDGSILWALARRGLLGAEAYAVDLSRERVELCASLAPQIRRRLARRRRRRSRDCSGPAAGSTSRASSAAGVRGGSTAATAAG